MKILYACTEDANNQNSWSGLVYHIRLAVEKAGCEIEVFDQIPFECPLPLRLFHNFYKRFSRQVHMLQIEPAILKNAARRIEARFRETGCDAVFCPGTGVPVYAFIDSEIPVFAYLDATKATWIQNYFGFDGLCERSRKLVHLVDRKALENNTLTLFSSEWALESAVRETGCPTNRVAVVPFGANLATPPKSNEVEDLIAARSPCKCQLLFLGKEWERKGGLEALAILRGLRAVGVSADLDIIGCKPEIAPDLKQFVRVHGFVDRSTKDGNARFREILSGAHLLLFLSNAEAYGLALCEANAFGVPCVATRVGGIPTIIRDGINGLLCDNPLRPELCVERILKLLQEPGTYREMARGARREFENRLNWTAAGSRIRELVESHLGNTKA